MISVSSTDSPRRKVSEALDANLPAALGGFSLKLLGQSVTSWISDATALVGGLIEGSATACAKFAALMQKLTRGVGKLVDNPLVNAPHTAQAVIVGEWEHAYTREDAVYPIRSLIRGKYWPPVRRIDRAYGDRNLVCACPPIEAFAD